VRGKKKQIPHCVRMTSGERSAGRHLPLGGEGPGTKGGPPRKAALQLRIRIPAAGAAGELAEGGVAYVLEVGDADFAGVEAVGVRLRRKAKKATPWLRA